MTKYDRHSSHDRGIQDCCVSLLIDPGVVFHETGRRTGLAHLGPGDRWPGIVPDNGMTARIEIEDARIDVCLAVRLDGLDDGTWMAFGGIPGVVSVLATPSTAWFAVDLCGMRVAAPLPLRGEPVWSARSRRLLQAKMADGRIKLYGLAGATVRTVHVGINTDRIWTVMSEALEAAPLDRSDGPQDEDIRRLSPDGLFAAAMRRHLQPLIGDGSDPTSSTIGRQTRQQGGDPSTASRRGPPG